MFPRAGSDNVGGLGDMEPAARRDPGTGEAVPASQLAERNAEAVRDGNKGVASAGSVKKPARRHSDRGYGNDERLYSTEAVTFA